MFVKSIIFILLIISFIGVFAGFLFSIAKVGYEIGYKATSWVIRKE